MQTSCLLETHFLPSTRYFSKFVLFDNVVLEQHENYQKRSFRNRAHILGANGVERLSVPLCSGKNQQMAIREVKISYDEPWNKRMCQAILSAYGSAPFYKHFENELFSMLMRGHTFLFDLNLELIHWFCHILNFEIPVLSNGYDKVFDNGRSDLRETIHPVRPSRDPNFVPFPYPQVFEDRYGFTPDLSVLDLVMSLGRDAIKVLHRSVVLKA